MEKSNNLWYKMSDSVILEILGEFMKETRLQQNKTQQELATASGIDRFTIARIENGKGGTLKSFIQMMRSLEQLHHFQNFQVQRQISPLELTKLEQRKRHRARSKKKSKKQNKTDW